MSNRKDLATALVLAVLYVLIWVRGERTEHLLVLACLAATLVYFVLRYLFGKAARNRSNRS